MAQTLNGTITCYFMGGAYEVTGTSVKKYFAIAGAMVAMRDASGLQYFLTDHLGSVVGVMDGTGTLTNQQRFLPFGGLRMDLGSITQTDFSYTGQRALNALGIYDYKARLYDGSIGRFISPDTVASGAGNPQGLNRYSYVGDSPIAHNDPSGHCEESDLQCLINLSQTNPNVSIPGVSGGGGNGGSGGGGGASTSTTADAIRHHYAGTQTPWSQLSPYEQAIMSASGCGPSCWAEEHFGGVTDISGTWQDPAVYISGSIACFASGLCITIGASAWSVVYKSGVSVIAYWATHNPDSPIVSIGRYRGYMDIAEEAGNKFTYFSMPQWAFSALRAVGLDKPVNQQFISTQISQAKNFVVTGFAQSGTALEMEIARIQSRGLYIEVSTEFTTFTSIFIHLP